MLRMPTSELYCHAQFAHYLQLYHAMMMMMMMMSMIMMIMMMTMMTMIMMMQIILKENQS